MFRSEIAKEEINRLEVRQFEGEIVVVEDDESLKRALDEILMYPMLGFDTESRPSFKKGMENGISLIQLSNDDKAWLFRVNKIGIPASLKRFLENDSVLKIGAGLQDDIKRIRKKETFAPAGFLDLQKYVEAFNIESKSLKKMVAIVLGYKISKSQQMSNWDSDTLSDQQQRYAATDAWVCLEIYKRLRESVIFES